MLARFFCFLAIFTLAAGLDFVNDPSSLEKDLQKCEVDSDCSFLRVCRTEPKFSQPHQGYCLHLGLFEQGVHSREVLLFVAVFFGVIVAAMAGIGGGGLLTPFLMLIAGFIFPEATPLSHATVFGNSIAQVLVNAPLRREGVPPPGMPLINYAAPLVLLPAQLGGNNIGILANKMIPPNILVSFAVLILVWCVIRVFQKAFKMLSIERKASNTAAGIGAIGSDDDDDEENTIERQNVNTVGSSDYLRERAAELRAADAVVPWKTVGVMAAFWFLFSIAFVIMKIAKKCSTGYWVALIAIYPIAFLFTLAGVKIVQSNAIEREKVGVYARDGDIIWTKKSIVGAPICAILVGIVSGLLGLGGGELMAPLLLELGMFPKIASATSSFMIIWSTSSDLVHYFFTGQLPPRYTVGLIITGFFGGYVGRHLAVWFSNKYNRQSIIAFALGFVLVVSGSLLVYKTVANPAENGWSPFSFTLCE